MTDREFAKQLRVTDFSLSAHSDLSEILRRRQRYLILGILVLSVMATALAFVGAETHADLGIAKAELPTWAGILSTLVFILALVDLLTSWGKKASRHEEAARELTALKALQRTALGAASGPSMELNAEYWRVMRAIEPIPDRWFARLKGRHLRKVEMSRALDRAPTTPRWVLRLYLYWRGTKQLLARGAKQPSAGEYVIDEKPGLNDEEDPTP